MQYFIQIVWKNLKQSEFEKYVILTFTVFLHNNLVFNLYNKDVYMMTEF